MVAAQARALAEARLGRPAQDALEAAVVLEAWGGLRPPAALDLGRRAIALDCARRTERQGAIELPKERPASHAFGALLALIVTAMWMGPLGDALGPQTIRRSWELALPIALVLQALVGRRYLSGRDGLGPLRSSAFEGLAVIIIPAAALVFVGTSGVVAAALIMVWVAVPIIVHRGWAWCYVSTAGGGWAALALDIPVLPAALAVGVLMVGTAAVAVASSPPSRRAPVPWVETAWAAVGAGGLGGLILLGAGLGAGLTSPIIVVALLPSLLGGVWAVQRLDRLWDVIPAMLRETPLSARNCPQLRRAVTMLLVGAFARLIAGTTVLSVLLLVVATEWRQPAAVLQPLLIALGIIAGINVLATALETCGASARAGSTTLVAFIATAAVNESGWADNLPGGPLVVGFGVAVAWSAPPLLALCRHAVASFATRID